MRCLGFLILLAAFAAASLPAAAGQSSMTAVPDRDRLASAVRHETAELRSFYAARDNRPAWSGSRDADADAQRLEAALAHVDADGLEPADYRIPPPSGDATEQDIRLTAAALRFAHDLHDGRGDLRRLDRDVELPSLPFDAATALAQAVASHDMAGFLAQLPPPNWAYAALKAALARYRDLADAKTFAALPEAGARRYAQDARLQAKLRARLALEDDHVSQTADLAQALRVFQRRNGLDESGQVDRATFASLNTGPDERALTIAANMERWRWLPRTLEPRRIEINVADQTLQAFSDDAAVLTSRVIVGRPRDPTPILRAEAVGVTVNPPWNVPAAIARREMLPKLRKHRDYLAGEDIVLVDGPPDDPHGLHIDWRAVSTGHFPWRLQQRPGAKNALGLVKLELPNRFDVYLHDTPAKTLFALQHRALSHGCVRVEEIYPLGAYALTGDAASVSLLESAVAAGQTETLPLKAPLPYLLLVLDGL